MRLSEPFIRRPVATTLLTLALALAGAVAYGFLPVSPLPRVEFPTINVQAFLPGASPDIMASAVATPLERRFGRIAGVTEMTSTSSLGATSITIQFDLSRNIDAAARDVQAGINAARGQLPVNLPTLPGYRKINPADAPILLLSLTSDVVGTPRLYDLASSILQQKLAQVPGVGQVLIGGASLPGVRVEVNPTALNRNGLDLEDVRAALQAASVNAPKGELGAAGRSWSLTANDQLLHAAEFEPLILSYAGGAPVRLCDVAVVEDSVEDVRTAGLSNGRPAVMMIVFRQPGANVIETVDRVRSVLPQLQAEISPAVRLSIVIDASRTIRASVRDVETTLAISVGLVILVVLLFLRNLRSTLIPSVAVVVSLIGTFGVMYLLGESVDNLSLMALTIATGFVVDDAIVVIENVVRHFEAGLGAFEAALRGAREIGFTVLSISLSLVAVFLPILLMGGVVGRLFREFAVTLSVAIMVSLIVSLTTTPMMCARLLRRGGDARQGALFRASERGFQAVLAGYGRSLRWVLGHRALTMSVAIATMAVTVWLYAEIPKGFFPQQDVGRLTGLILADQDTSFQAMRQKLARFEEIVMQDPAVESANGFLGGLAVNAGRMYVSLKPQSERPATADEVVARLRGRLAKVTGATLILQPVQDLRVGGMATAAQYQYMLQADDAGELFDWAPRVLSRLRQLPELTDVNSDQQDRGLQVSLAIDRATASRLGVTTQRIDDVLYDAFGQRQVSTMYTSMNQYHVVMEVDSRFGGSPEVLRYVRVRGAGGALVPLAAVTHEQASMAPLSINHQGQFPSVTMSFNLAQGVALGTAVAAVRGAEADIRLPDSVRRSFQGTAQAFQASLAGEALLIGVALLTVYMVLGILYESLVHPITILSTLPSAGVGALLALRLFGYELSIIGLIGIILLIGIVKKNGILVIDFAIDAQRSEGKSPESAVFQACVLRFRPIIMTTAAAMLGGLPLAIGFGTGAELRRPLGIAIVGGLLFSQILTLYTTPVVYLYLERLRVWTRLPRLRPGPRRKAAACVKG